MKNLIQFATRIDKELKEKVIEFSKTNDTSVQNIVEYSLENTLSKKDFNKNKAEVFMENKLKENDSIMFREMMEYIHILESFIDENSIKLDSETNRHRINYEIAYNNYYKVVDLYLESREEV